VPEVDNPTEHLSLVIHTAHADYPQHPGRSPSPLEMSDIGFESDLSLAEAPLVLQQGMVVGRNSLGILNQCNNVGISRDVGTVAAHDRWSRCSTLESRLDITAGATSIVGNLSGGRSGWELIQFDLLEDLPVTKMRSFGFKQGKNTNSHLFV